MKKILLLLTLMLMPSLPAMAHVSDSAHNLHLLEHVFLVSGVALMVWFVMWGWQKHTK